MSDLTFDTYDEVKKLKIAGFSEDQAAALTNLQKVTAQTALEQARHDYQLDEIATKHDLKNLELELKANISETKADLIKWVVVIGAVQLTIITGLMLRLTGKV